MELTKLISTGLRVVLVVLGAVVAGFSATLAKHQHFGSVPGQTGFGTFVGGFGIVAGLIGIAAMFASFIPIMVLLGIDAATTILYLAGGIVLAATMGGVDCNADTLEGLAKLQGSSILNGGVVEAEGKKGYGVGLDAPDERFYPELKNRCVRAQTDYTVMLVAAAFGIAVLVLTIIRRRKEKGSVV